MSDLLSPFIILFEDNADAFWCFETLLRRMVYLNLGDFFCLRYILTSVDPFANRFKQYDTLLLMYIFMPPQRENFQMEGPTGVMKQLQSLWRILELTDKEMFAHLSHVGAESLHFAFRMLLVLFRRELSFNEALCMWEVCACILSFSVINVAVVMLT